MAKNKFHAVIIGAGKIAWSLAAALPNAGIEIISVISRTEKSARLLAKKYGISHYSSKLKNIPPEADLFLVTVPDNKIKETADKLSVEHKSFMNCLSIHFSGVETTGALISISKKGGMTGSIHIMQTFPSKDVAPVTGCYAAIETENKSAKKLLFEIANNLKLKPFSISSEKKALYHLSGVLAANFLVGNFYASGSLHGNNISPGKLLGGITSRALANVADRGAVNVLSGPVERGDIETIQKHLNALESISNKEGVENIRLSYISQSLVLLDLVKARDGRLSPAHSKIKKLLKTELLKKL